MTHYNRSRSADRLHVVYEDEHLIVIEKPSGLLSVGFPGHRGKTAHGVLEHMYKARGKGEVFVVHRLDRDTSGLMVFARTSQVRDRLMDEWHNLVSERIYRCVCRRRSRAAPLPDSGIIDACIAYNRHDVGFVPGGDDRASRAKAEKAITRFTVLERGPCLDLIECALETGKKNQIRVHMAHLGHPLAGDSVYGDETTHDGLEIGRLALHARVLAFCHPVDGTLLRFESPEPASFSELARRTGRISREKPEPACTPDRPHRSTRSGQPGGGSRFIPGR